MPLPAIPPPTPPPITDREFEALRQIIRDHTGIFLRDVKRTLLVSRLAKRLRALGCDGFDDYVEIVRASPPEGELSAMINCITTNKTSFFREPHHFEVLRRRLIELRDRRGARRRVRIWSAGCSTGQEPYTIAMIVREVFGDATGWDVRVLATDIDTDVLETAARGVYDTAQVAEVPPAQRQQWFERASPSGDLWQVAPALRALVDVRRLNLVQASWPMRGRFDAIFCRNVTIYFDSPAHSPTQRAIYERFARALEADGRFFAGHSENLYWLSDLFQPIGDTVYTLAGARPRRSGRPSSAPRDVSLAAGEAHASAVPEAVHAMVRDGAAACVFDPAHRVGGVVHVSLARGAGGPPIDELVRRLVSLGGDATRFAAKVFGRDADARAAMDGLAVAGIPVLAKRLSSGAPIELRFFTATGRALVRLAEERAR